jgi:hypothetical protein
MKRIIDYLDDGTIIVDGGCSIQPPTARKQHRTIVIDVPVPSVQAEYWKPNYIRPQMTSAQLQARQDREEWRSMGYCTPTRYDSLTGGLRFVTIEQVQAAAAHLAVKMEREQSQPEQPQPIAVPDWPKPAVVVEPEPVPVVVNRTAARFASLELR